MSRVRRVYVGDLPGDVRDYELRDLFSRYGRINRVDIKSRADDRECFAFIEFDDDRDAVDAVRGEDRRHFPKTNYRMRVELQRPRDQMESGMGGGIGVGAPLPPAPGLRVIVSGLSDRTSWQDLKDHGRRLVSDDPKFPIKFSDVKSDPEKGGRTGVLEFLRPEDAAIALEKMNGSELAGSVLSAVMETEENPWVRAAAGAGRGGGDRRDMGGRGGGYDSRRGGYDDRRGGGYDDRRGGYDRRDDRPSDRDADYRRGGGGDYDRDADYRRGGGSDRDGGRRAASPERRGYDDRRGASPVDSYVDRRRHSPVPMDDRDAGAQA